MNRLTLDTALTPQRLADLKRGAPDTVDIAREAVHNAGVVMGGRPGMRTDRPQALHDDPRKTSPRWPYAVMRMRRLLEGCARSSSIEEAVRGSEYPRLAQEYIEHYTYYYMTRHRPAPLAGIDHNPYRGLSDVDAQRMFVRKVEDIADRSTGKLGAWYVK